MGLGRPVAGMNSTTSSVPGSTGAPSPADNSELVVRSHTRGRTEQLSASTSLSLVDAGERAERRQAVPLPRDASWWMTQFGEGWSVADLAIRLNTNHVNIYHHLRALEITPPESQSAEKWVEARTTREGACLLWKRAFLHGRPVGKADGVHGRTVRRIVWEQAVGPIPEGAWIVRKPECPHLDCVAVDYRRVVSPQTHIAERVDTLRFRWGEDHGNAKLSEADARTILKNRSADAGELAARFSVSKATVYAIWAGRRWGHLNPGT